jgi:hypothetical protein
MFLLLRDTSFSEGRQMLIAIENKNNNFEVYGEQELIIAVVVQTELGWRVMSRTQRKNSRTHSATPEEAAKKYYRKKVIFFRRGI